MREVRRRALSPLRKSLTAILLMVVAAAACGAGLPGLSKPGDAGKTDAPSDPLGRESPRGAIVGFSRVMDRNDQLAAARYLQVDSAQRPQLAGLTTELKTLIDRDLHESLANISDAPQGSLEDGLPEDRERVGPLAIEGETFFIQLVRVKEGDNGLVWLIARETLQQIPTVVDNTERSWIERNLPPPLLATEFAGLTLAHWIVLLSLLLGIFVALALLSMAARLSAHALIRQPERRQAWDAWFDATRWPAIGVLTILLQFFAIPPLGYPLTFRVSYARVGLVVLVVLITWLVRRGMRLVFTHARGMVRGRDRASTQSLMLLTERMLQALLVVVAIVLVLILLGVESKTALAGLGVVGVALALGAQKTVENLLGGIFLLSDKALAVGDYCTIGAQSGTVEDVTLRSVRLRTAQQSLVSLPAGSLAQAGIENFATRQKMLALHLLRLRYGTQAAQLRQVLDGIRARLQRDPHVEQGNAYVRLINFGAEAIELELSAYFLTREAEEFRAWREELLLDIATIVEAAGSALAPTRFVQVDDPGTGSAVEKAAAAAPIPR